METRFVLLSFAVAFCGCLATGPATANTVLPLVESKQEPAPLLRKAQNSDEGTQTESPTYSILHWNVESGGNDPALIAKQLIELGRYDIIGLSEVDAFKPYIEVLTKEYEGEFEFIEGTTGINFKRDSDRLLICYDKTRFDLVESAELDEAGGVKFNNGRHRTPLYARLKDRRSKQEMIVILNQLARADAYFRAEQAAGLREWARAKSAPMIAIGDYNFDYDFHNKKGNSGFDAFLRDGVWKWVKPEKMIDTNWSDDGRGNDSFPGSILDFSFVAGAAKDWQADCRVIVREGDFPDDEMTSNHRPVELVLTSNRMPPDPRRAPINRPPIIDLCMIPIAAFLILLSTALFSLSMDKDLRDHWLFDVKLGGILFVLLGMFVYMFDWRIATGLIVVGFCYILLHRPLNAIRKTLIDWRYDRNKK